MKTFKGKNIIKSLKSIPEFLARNAFLTVLILFLVALIFGAFVFYNYSFLADKKDFGKLDNPFIFNDGAYQRVIKVWQDKEEKFNTIESIQEEYPFYSVSEKAHKLTE